MTSRRVRHLQLHAESQDDARRGFGLVEDALGSAALPGAEDGRLVFVRRLELGVLPESASELVARVERMLEGIVRIHAENPSAPAASAVWFRDAIEARVLLLERLARRESVAAWFWRLIEPEVPLARGPAAVATVLATIGQWGAVALRRAVLELDARASLAPVLDCIGEDDARVLLVAVGPGWAPAAPTIWPYVAARIARWGPADPRVAWLVRIVGGPDEEVHATAREIVTQTPVPSGWTTESAVEATADTKAPPAAPPQAQGEAPPLRPGAEPAPRLEPQPPLAFSVSAPSPADPHAPPRPIPHEAALRAGVAFEVEPPEAPTTERPPGAPVARPEGAAEVASPGVPPVLDATYASPTLAAGLLFLVPLGCDRAVLLAVAGRLELDPADPLVQAITEIEPTEEPAAVDLEALEATLAGLAPEPAARSALAWLVCRPGRIAASRTHLDLWFLLENVDLAVRRAGLDIDPGWVPHLGRVVRFHYVDPRIYHALG